GHGRRVRRYCGIRSMKRMGVSSFPWHGSPSKIGPSGCSGPPVMSVTKASDRWPLPGGSRIRFPATCLPLSALRFLDCTNVKPHGRCRPDIAPPRLRRPLVLSPALRRMQTSDSDDGIPHAVRFLCPATAKATPRTSPSHASFALAPSLTVPQLIQLHIPPILPPHLIQGMTDLPQ